MAENSLIEWTEATWNPITGCSIHSSGCTHCYAMTLAGTRLKNHPSREGLTTMTKVGPIWNGQLRFNANWIDQPIAWKRPRDIFVCAHSDLFHQDMPEEWIDEVFARMAIATHHRFQVLTKRADRMHAYFKAGPQWRWMKVMKRVLIERGMQPPEWGVMLKTTNGCLPNVWLGVSVEDQAAAEQRIPYLLATRAAVRWISAEPLLGPLDLTAIEDRVIHKGFKVSALTGWGGWEYPVQGPQSSLPNVHWVVVGGENARSRARPWDDKWARALRDQCRDAQVPFFMKQTRNKGPIPADLMVREYPR